MFKSLLFVALFAAATVAVIPTCSRTFELTDFTSALPANQDVAFDITIGADAAGTFDSVELFVDIKSANTGDIKIRARKNGGSIVRVARNNGGSNANLYAGTLFFDGASNTPNDVRSASSDGVITPIQPERPLSGLGSIGAGDTVTLLIRSNSAGNTLDAASVVLNLSGCSPTSGPTTAPTTVAPTTPNICRREFEADISSPVSVSDDDGDVSFAISVGANIASGTFQYLEVVADIETANSGSLTLRMDDGTTTIPLIRGVGGSTADLWSSITLFDGASQPIGSVSTSDSEAIPLRALSTFGTPSSGDSFTFLVKTGDSSNDAIVNSIKLVAVLADCGTTVAPTTEAPTTPEPTTAEPTTIATCVREFDFETGTVSLGSSDSVFSATLGPNVNSGTILELQAFVDIDSTDSSAITVRLQRGGVTRALIRGGNSNANLWAGVTLSDSAAVRLVDVTSFTSEVQPLFPLSSFSNPSQGDDFTFLVKSGSGTASVNSLKLLLLMTDCGTTVAPTTIAPTTTPVPTTTPEPTTTPAECVRTYVMEDNLPWVANTANGAVARPRFTTQQTGGTILWADVYAEVDCEQPGQLTMALSIEGDSTRRSMTQNIGGNQVNLFGATRWFNGAARSVTSVQPTGETAPIAELRPLEFDFSAQDVDLTINKQLRLVITYDGTGDVVVNAFEVTFGFTGCEATVTPAPTTPEPTTTAEPTTTEPSTTEPSSR